MEKRNIDYLEKNIAVSSKLQYKIMPISKTEKVVKAMKWKVLEFYGKLNDNNKENFGLKSIKCPPAVSELLDFESKLTLIVNNKEFSNTNNDFQNNSKMTWMRLKLLIKYLYLQISQEIYTN